MVPIKYRHGLFKMSLRPEVLFTHRRYGGDVRIFSARLEMNFPKRFQFFFVLFFFPPTKRRGKHTSTLLLTSAIIIKSFLAHTLGIKELDSEEKYSALD